MKKPLQKLKKNCWAEFDKIKFSIREAIFRIENILHRFFAYQAPYSPEKILHKVAERLKKFISGVNYMEQPILGYTVFGVKIQE